MITNTGLKFSIILRVIWKRIAFYTVLSCAVVISYEDWGQALQFPDTPLSIFGTLLAILLGFRVNNAYQRWWEARKLWGKIVNDSRSCARETINFLQDADAETRQRMVYRQIGFCYALRNQLRGQPKGNDLEPFFTRWM